MVSNDKEKQRLTIVVRLARIESQVSMQTSLKLPVTLVCVSVESSIPFSGIDESLNSFYKLQIITQRWPMVQQHVDRPLANEQLQCTQQPLYHQLPRPRTALAKYIQYNDQPQLLTLFLRASDCHSIFVMGTLPAP
jgi:hypothetical protein